MSIKNINWDNVIAASFTFGIIGLCVYAAITAPPVEETPEPSLEDVERMVTPGTSDPNRFVRVQKEAIAKLYNAATKMVYSHDKLEVAQQITDIGVNSHSEETKVFAIDCLDSISSKLTYGTDRKAVSEMILNITMGKD